MDEAGTPEHDAEQVKGQDVELQHLIQMLGDIERNLAFYPDAGERIAQHLKKFWAPSMRQRILEFARSEGEGLTDLSRSALDTLASY